jgi:hypothetical protein
LRKINQINKEQMDQIAAYRDLNVFFIAHGAQTFLIPVRFIVYFGIGILIYENIDSISHIAILTLLLVVTVICFYFSFKMHPDFKSSNQFENPLFDYLILRNVLSCIFIGYLQFQYTTFGTITTWPH